MHLVGKKIKVTIKLPNKPKETLLEIGAWDYNWQETYFLKDPLKLPVGTVLDVEAIYDNSVEESQQPEQSAQARHLRRADDQRNVFRLLGRDLRRQRAVSVRAIPSAAAGGATVKRRKRPSKRPRANKPAAEAASRRANTDLGATVGGGGAPPCGRVLRGRIAGAAN